MRRYLILLLPLLTPLAGCDSSREEESSVKETPEVGALVRAQVPKLGPDWQMGMFNRIRVEPPCYLVLLFSSDGSNRVAHTLALSEVEKLEVHRFYNWSDRGLFPEALARASPREDWAEVALDSLQARNRRTCPSPIP